MRTGLFDREPIRRIHTLQCKARKSEAVLFMQRVLVRLMSLAAKAEDDSQD